MTSADPVVRHECSMETIGEMRIEALLAAYSEVCVSYHAIDDFRTKLLGILPISSLAGIILLGQDSFLAQETPDPNFLAYKLIGFGSCFAAAFTLALFLFEIRGLIRCHHLIQRGKELERALNVYGQFSVCALQHDKAQTNRTERIFNAKVAASAVYSLVFSAWLFMALRFSFNVALLGCGLTATIVGGALGVGTYFLLSKSVAA